MNKLKHFFFFLFRIDIFSPIDFFLLNCPSRIKFIKILVWYTEHNLLNNFIKAFASHAFKVQGKIMNLFNFYRKLSFAL